MTAKILTPVYLRFAYSPLLSPLCGRSPSLELKRRAELAHGIFRMALRLFRLIGLAYFLFLPGTFAASEPNKFADGIKYRISTVSTLRDNYTILRVKSLIRESVENLSGDYIRSNFGGLFSDLFAAIDIGGPNRVNVGGIFVNNGLLPTFDCRGKIPDAVCSFLGGSGFPIGLVSFEGVRVILISKDVTSNQTGDGSNHWNYKWSCQWYDLASVIVLTGTFGYMLGWCVYGCRKWGHIKITKPNNGRQS